MGENGRKDEVSTGVCMYIQKFLASYLPPSATSPTATPHPRKKKEHIVVHQQELQFLTQTDQALFHGDGKR